MGLGGRVARYSILYQKYSIWYHMYDIAFYIAHELVIYSICHASRGKHNTHLVPYSTGPRQLGRRYEARRLRWHPPLRAQLVDLALLSGAGIFRRSLVNMYIHVTCALHLAAPPNLHYWRVTPSREVLFSTIFRSLSWNKDGSLRKSHGWHYGISKAYGKIPNARTQGFAQTTWD